MKRLLLFAVVATLFAACTQEIIVDVTNPTIADNTPETLVVGFEEGDETRIQLNEAQKTVWTKGDQVSVFYRSDANQKWHYQGETGERIAELTRVDEGVATEEMKRVVVVYPYNDDYYINTETYNIQAFLPAVQTYLKDSYGLNGNIMISQSEYNNFSLKSVCGWLKLQLTGNGEKIKSITLKGNNGEQVAGELYINSADATATLSSDTGSADDGETGGAGGGLVFEDTILKEVTLDCGKGVALGKETSAFYIALPPQTFENGFTVEIEAMDGSIMTKSTDKTFTIERNHIQPMAAFAYDGVEQTNVIRYTATRKIEPRSGDWGANLISNDWNEHTGKGIITFDGEVTKIPNYAFGTGLIDWMKSIIIPSSVTVIGDGAFSGMSLNQGVLEDIIFAKNSKLEKIGDGAFKLNASLKNIYLPNTVKEIGKGICFGCGALEGVYLSNDYYDNWHFGGASALYKYDGNNKCNIIVFPAVFSDNNQPSNVLGGATNIEYGAISMSNIGSNLHWWWFENIDSYNFANCDALSWVTLDRVQTIGNYVLYMCDALLSIDLPMASVIGRNCFTDNSVLKSISLGCDELEIISSMGSNCPMLTTLRIPAGVASITSSFNSCGALEEIFVKALVPPVLTDSFDSMVAPTIYVPAGSVNAYKSAEGWKEFADYIVGYNFETGELVEGYGIDDSDLDHNKYLTYVANHSHLLDFESEDYYYWDTYFEHNVNGIMVAEYKFQLAATQNYTIQYISDDSIYIEGNELYVYSESYYNNYDERERRYNTIDLTTIGIQPTDLIVLRVDAANNVVTINDQEISFNKIGAAMSSKYIFSAYDSVSDEGHAYYYDGMIDGAKLYYAKGWDSNGYLTYLGYASTDINDKTGNVEACWRAKYYNGKIVETTTFANDRYVEDYVPLGMGNM